MDQAGIYHQGISKGKHHKGPRTAGNKSLISFRAGHGVTGYAGYIPSSESILIPTKEGPSLRGPPIQRERAQVEDENVLKAQMETHPTSVYTNTYSSSTAPQIGKSTDNLNNSNTVDLKNVITDSTDFDQKPQPQRFLAKSTYQMSFDSTKAAASGSVTPATFRTKPAYLAGTTYSASYENSAELKSGVGWLNNKQFSSNPSYFGALWKEVSMQRPIEPTSYQADFGFLGSGISGQLPPLGDKGMSEQGTTRTLFAGTSKAFRRIPGFCGFMPAAHRNIRSEVALDQALDNHDRPDPKACRLFTLNQYLLDIPGTVCFHPKEAVNLMEPPKGRVGTTTTAVNAYLSNPDNLRHIVAARAGEAYFGASQETKKFFQGGEISLSENGKKNAERFYKLARPREGVPRILRPSVTTDFGYRFGCYTGAL